MSSPAAEPATELRRAQSSAPLQFHPLSLEYIRLKVSAVAIRAVLCVLQPLAEYFYQPVPQEVSIFKASIPSRDACRSIRAHVYSPKNAPKGEKLPVHLNFHGSGFVLPSLGFDAEFCGQMAKQLGCFVVDCDYRKAPEYPAPAQVQDAEDCVLWCLSQSSQYDLSRLSIGGFSAGANLALCASSLHGDHLTACIAFYPPTDFRIPYDAKIAPEKHAAALTPDNMKFFDHCYLVAGAGRADPLVSPAVQDTSKFPPHVWVTCATGDTLYYEGEKFIEKLNKEGHPDARFHKILSEGHAFDKMTKAGTGTAAKKDEAYRLALEMVKESWNGNRPIQ